MCILRITFPISRLMGLAPYSNDLDYSGFWAAYSLIFCSLIFITVVIVNYNYISTGEERHDEWILNPYNLKLYLAQIHLQGFALGMHLFKITIRDKEFAQVLKFIKETFVGPITISIIFSSGSSTILGLCWLFECYMSWPIVDPPDPTTMWTFFTAMYGDMVCFVIVMQFCATISVLKFGFAHITYVLKRTRFKYVRKLILRHSSLIHRTKYVNQFYSKQLVAIITLTALNYVSWAFFGLQDFMRSSPQLILGLSKLQQAFYQLYLLLCLCRCCDATIIEVSTRNRLDGNPCNLGSNSSLGKDSGQESADDILSK